MPAHRLTMRKTREILRLRAEQKLSHREIGASVKCSPGTVGDALGRAKVAGLGWPLPESLDDEALERLLYPPPEPSRPKPEPDFAAIYRELKRKGVTLQLLWQEYKGEHQDGYQYSQFCNRYRAWRSSLELVMRQDHRGGEKTFVDYAGLTMPVVDPATGEVSQAQIFVAALGGSSFTYCEAQSDQSLQNWTDGHIRAFESFGGCSAVWVPDNLKSGVKSPCYYEPEINPTYKDLADHYGAVVIPARVRKPRDKAKVENAVLQVERWVLAPLRKQTFFSLEELNTAIWRKLDELNDRPLSKLDGTRRTLFVEIDQPALKPLPPQRFRRTYWKIGATVNIDYHVEFDGHYYSVPYTLSRQKVDIRATTATVEILRSNHRVASHQRGYRRGCHTTDPAHRPKSHQRHTWPPSRIIRWAETIGPNAAALVQRILQKRAHPEQGYRSCLGIMRLGKGYGTQRLEAACHRAIAVDACSYRSVASILKTGLDKQPIGAKCAPQQTIGIDHDNVRGADYYK